VAREKGGWVRAASNGWVQRMWVPVGWHVSKGGGGGWGCVGHPRKERGPGGGKEETGRAQMNNWKFSFLSFIFF
jgi:hypothetical protein